MQYPQRQDGPNWTFNDGPLRRLTAAHSLFTRWQHYGDLHVRSRWHTGIADGCKGPTVRVYRDSFKRLTSVQRYDANGVLQPNDSYSFYYDTNPLDSGFSQNALGRVAFCKTSCSSLTKHSDKPTAMVCLSRVSGKSQHHQILCDDNFALELLLSRVAPSLVRNFVGGG
jgi:hypothetical protein